MGVSIIEIQRDLIISTIRNTTRGDVCAPAWKVLVVDADSRKLIENVVKEDDILNENITNIENIEDRRMDQPDTDAVYFLHPKPHIIDCVMADFERRKYRGAFLVWTTLPAGPLRERLERSQMAQQQIRSFKVCHLDFHPRESHLITFQDPWSFPVLFHPECNNLVRHHMEEIAERLTGVCVALGEYPTIRYYRPRNPSHDAAVLCSHLARFVQDKLDTYAQYNPDFPPQSNRPRGVLYITDRSMDLYAPLLHEFTFQAMVHDLLRIQEGDKVTYKTVVSDEDPDAEEKDMEISDKDKIWVEYRHRHMTDTISKLPEDFRKFMANNAVFTNQEASKGGMQGLNAIKDMMAGLPQFTAMKEAYSLNISMAEECMSMFQQRKLPDLASVEQCLATGLDEDYKKAKGLADQVIRSLDDDAVTPADRLRLIALYGLYRDGIVAADLNKLLLHSQLPLQDGDVLKNLNMLGARMDRALKEKREPPQPLFSRHNAPPLNPDDSALSRYDPVLKHVLEEHVAGRLPQDIFPYTKMQPDDPSMQEVTPAASLRSAKPTWAKSRLANVEPRQRVIVFIGGGATYSESRSCYEISEKTSRDVFLVTSHMVNPGLYLRQVGDLSQSRRALHLPADQPPPKAPDHLFEKPAPPKPAPPPAAAKPMPSVPGGLPSRPGGQAPPTAAMANMSVNPQRPQVQAPAPSPSPAPSGKGGKEKEKKKKKHHFFSSKS
ncbi:syntaxin-binding protein-like protein 2 [Massarina eburnea CBS 473.64]|uniref:Syntaxin-binding protein-like protein 2 n=1 Tax=Massarina eburnea CBS 473.64 TaxID=1395130 RepID=A0A6A6SDI3_9PLEO|nr:syntaxin-binding protein-like protein 2 [Massarina eburnea CBS 473.64]